MNHRLTSALLVLLVASTDAFSTTIPRMNDVSFNVLSRTNSQPKINRQKVVVTSGSRRPSTSLNMSPAPVAGAIAGALTGGLFAGGLHAIAGECFRLLILEIHSLSLCSVDGRLTETSTLHTYDQKRPKSLVTIVWKSDRLLLLLLLLYLNYKI